MSTRAIQIDFLLAGITDSLGNILAGGSVKFYAAGTTTAKNVYTEKEKTNPFTTYTLDASGAAQLYGDGIYKVLAYDSSSVLKRTWDNVKIRAHNYAVVSKVSAYTTTADDDVILVNTTAGHVTITMLAAASMEYPQIIKHTAGTNNVVIDPNASETIDGDATYTFSSIGGAIIVFSDGSNLRKANHVALDIIDGLDLVCDSITLNNTGLHILDSNASHDLIIKPGSNLTADRELTITTGDVARTLEFGGKPVFSGLNDGTYDIALPTNNMEAAKFMIGNSSTIIWMYLNTAPPGWKALATGADTVLGVAGGAQAYNVNGGNAGGTWTQPNHKHKWYDFISNAAHASWDTDGSPQIFTTSSNAHLGIRVEDDGVDTIIGQDFWTNENATAVTWRPSASVGKLFQLDTA